MQSTHMSAYGQFPASGRAGSQLSKFASASHFLLAFLSLSKKENYSRIKGRISTRD